MFQRKNNNNWVMLSSAMLGGFMLGFTYKKYGKNITHRLRSISSLTREKLNYDDGYTTSHEPDA